MQASLSDLILTAALAGSTTLVALSAVVALPWSAGEVEATEAALRRVGRWAHARVLLLLAGEAALPVVPALPVTPRARAA